MTISDPVDTVAQEGDRTPEWSAITSARDLLVAAVGVTSHSGEERELAERLREHAAAAGLRSWVDDVGNVHAVVGSGHPVMLVSHLDTVGGVVPFAVTDDAVHGRGAVDAKGALVAMLAATIRLADRGVALHWVGAVEEETIASRGAEHLLRTCDRPAALIVGEPSGTDCVTIGYKGKADFRYDVEVPAAHTATPEAKASELAVGFLSAVLERYASDGNGSFRRPGLTIRDGRVEPDRASCVLSFRLPPGQDVGRLHAELAGLAGDDGRLTLLHTVPAVVTSRTDPAVSALSSAIAEHGMRPRHVLKTGTSDMNTLARLWDVPMATYGPGDSHLDHSAAEHLRFDEFERSVDVLTTALLRLSAAPGRKERR